jgi:hypothetical protein
MGRDGAFHGVLNEPARVATGPVIQSLGGKEAPMSFTIGTAVTIVIAVTISITVRVKRRRRRKK